MTKNKKISTARLSIISNTALLILKFIVGLITGSVSIISEAIHSGMDLLAAIIAYFSVRIADRPADNEHPYGHGKFENISGVIEALLIFLAAGWIIYEATHKLFDKNFSIDYLYLGILVMAISAVVNFFVSKKLYKVAKETDSVALEADALHLKTDVYTSMGTFFALLIIHFLNWNILDPIIAILIAGLIIKESYVLLKKAYRPLLDTSLSKHELDIIEDILRKYTYPYHDLRTRKAGQYRFAELHLELPSDKSLKEIHEICDEIENQIKTKINFIQINIHVEPNDETS